jgi:sulfur carrier protein
MEEGIQIHVNGEARRWRPNATVADLLRDLDIKTERVAVELNLEILDRQVFPHRHLKHGDRVEILSFISGGTGGRPMEPWTMDNIGLDHMDKWFTGKRML